MAVLPPEMDGRIEELRNLARQNLPLGEIAHRMGVGLHLIRDAADRLGITVVRDNRRGGPRAKMAYRESASAYVSELRAVRAAVIGHSRRVAHAAPMTPQQEQEAIARFIAQKGVTQCPTASAEGASSESGPSRLVPPPGQFPEDWS